MAVKEESLQKQIFQEILDNNYSVRDVEKAHRSGKIIKTRTNEAYVVPNKDFFERRLKEYLKYDKIKIESKKGKIQFVVEFNTETELKNWLKSALHKN